MTEFIIHMRMPLYRNAYALIISGAATSGLGLLYWTLAARYYPASDVGLNSAVLSAMLLLSGISQLGLNSVLFRFVPLAGRSTNRLVGYAYFVSVSVAAVMGVAFCLGVDWWSPALGFLHSNRVWLVSFVLANMIWCIFALQDSVLTSLRQALWVPIENTTFGMTKIVLLVALAVPLQHSGLFASWIVPAALTLLPINWLIFRRLVPQHIQATDDLAKPIIPSQIVKYVSGNYLGTLFAVASTTLLPIIVTNQVGASATAYFFLPWTILTSLQMIALNLTTSLTVEAALDRTQLRAFCLRVLSQTWRLLVPLVAIILLGAYYILLIFGNAYAARGTDLLRLLALSTLPNIAVALSISIARVQNRPGLIALIQGSLCGLVLGLSFILLPVWGITGIGLGWLIAQTVVALALVLKVLSPILRTSHAVS
jgi:O-antigen/teichoic acid export membrane protein